MIEGVNFKLTRLPCGIVHNRDMTMYAVPNMSSLPTVTELLNTLLKDTVALKGIIESIGPLWRRGKLRNLPSKIT